MTKLKGKAASASIKDSLLHNPDGLRDVIRAVMQEVLEADVDETLGASKGERTPERLGYRSGHYRCTLITRVGKLELMVPQDQAGHFSTELFERLSALGARPSGDLGGDVGARRFHPQRQNDPGRVVRPFLLGLVDLGHQHQMRQ